VEGDAASDGHQLPNSWLHAIQTFEAGRVMPHYLGEEFIQVFAACRRHERQSFEANVTPMELEWYLRTV
ncbi:MAG: glutamine synthetase, partial [Gammaproteobacteria bacterium]|jgi:glutamine synthetase